jgi:hypothetical protein
LEDISQQLGPPLTWFLTQLKLRYWREKTFNFLGLPPEIRLMIYRYTLPEDRTYYMTARKYRYHGHLPDEEFEDEIIPQPLSLLRVCRQVHHELRPMVYENCVFYLTIYSIRDLLYTIDLLDKYTVPHNFDQSRDIFYHMRNIRIRVSDLILDIYPYHRVCRRYAWTKFSESTQLWIGPGVKTFLKDATQFAETVSRSQRREGLRALFDAAEDEDVIRLEMLRTPMMERWYLDRMLPWFHRDRRWRYHEFSTEPV